MPLMHTKSCAPHSLVSHWLGWCSGLFPSLIVLQCDRRMDSTVPLKDGFGFVIRFVTGTVWFFVCIRYPKSRADAFSTAYLYGAYRDGRGERCTKGDRTGKCDYDADFIYPVYFARSAFCYA